MSRGGAVRGVRLLPGISLALWQTEFVDTIVSYLLAGTMRRDLMLLSPIQGGLTTFLTAQLAPAISALARWVYLPLGQFISTPAADAVQLALHSLATELAPKQSLSAVAPSAFDRRVRDLVQADNRLVVLCIDDAQVHPESVDALRSFASAVANLRLLIGSHEPLPGPFAQMTLPSMSLDQISTMIGPGHPSEEVELLAWWAGRRPPLLRDLAMATEAGLPNKPWKERLAAAARKLCDQHDCHPYAVRLRAGVKEAQRRFLACLAQGDSAISDYPAAVALIRLGILQMTSSSKLEFASPIVKHWFLMENTANLCRVMTEKGSRVVPAEEANRLLEAGKKRAKSDPHYLVVDARPPVTLWYRSGGMEVGDDVVKFLRVLCESRAASVGRPITVLHRTLQKAALKSDDSRQWVYGVKHKVNKALGLGVIELDRGAGFRLSEKVRFLWVEPLAA